MIPSYKAMQLLQSQVSWFTPITRVKQENGKTRLQFKPNKAVRFAQRLSKQLLDIQLSKKKILFPSATGFVKSGGIDKHFQRHVNQIGCFDQYWFVTDLKNAYGSIDTYTLANLLVQLFSVHPNPYPEQSEDWYICEEFFKSSQVPIRTFSPFTISDMAAYLSHYFLNPETHQGLAEGYPMSPLLFNLYAEFTIDAPLRKLCNQLDITYSRFADDLIFTSNLPIGKVKKKKIKQAIAQWFHINQQKR